MRLLNTVYVREHRARVGHRRGSLLVRSPDGSQKVPLEAVDAVVMLGGGQITTQALEACVKRNVRVVALRQGGSVRFVVGGPTGGNVHLRAAQYDAVADEGQSLIVARAVIASKLQNSRRVLGRWSRDERDGTVAEQIAERAKLILERIPRLPGAETLDEVRGIEGDAARTYFGGMRLALSRADVEFTLRTKRPPRDPVNAVLSFCYSLLVTEFIGACEAVGLDYQLGFLHRPRSGRPSLALDLAEELRPLTDRFAVSLVRRRQLVSDHFVEAPGGAVYLTDDGRTQLLKAWERHKESEQHHEVVRRRVGRWALPSVQATLLARFLRGDLPAYAPYVME